MLCHVSIIENGECDLRTGLSECEAERIALAAAKRGARAILSNRDGDWLCNHDGEMHSWSRVTAND